MKKLIVTLRDASGLGAYSEIAAKDEKEIHQYFDSFHDAVRSEMAFEWTTPDGGVHMVAATHLHSMSYAEEIEPSDDPHASESGDVPADVPTDFRNLRFGGESTANPLKP